jgi:hypothetical protein
MCRLLLAFLFLSIGFTLTYAQLASPEYGEQRKVSVSLFKKKKYCEAGAAFKKLFEWNGDLGGMDDRYMAACSFAMCAKVDDAFVQLFRIVEEDGFNDSEKLLKDEMLVAVRSDERWGRS